LVGLGLWTDLAGPFGRALADGAGTVLGRARVALPVAACTFAVLLGWPGRTAPDDADEWSDDSDEEPGSERPTVRIAVGAAFLLLADVGVLHLIGGRPDVEGSMTALRSGGGYLGAAVGEPLAGAAGVVGASVVLTGLGVIGLLLVLGLSISTAGAA